MKKYYFLLICTLLISHLSFSQNNTLSENVKVWYETQLNEKGLLIWQDKTPNKKDLKTFKQPSKSDILNFHHSLSFNGMDNSLDIPIGEDELSEATFFIVYQADDTISERAIWHFNSDKSCKMLLTTHRMAQFSPNEYINFIEQKKDKVQLSAFVRYVPKSSKQPLAQTLIIGKKPLNPKLPISAFKGKIAEIMVFDRMLDYEIFLQVQSYLALKYGITLDYSYYNTEGVAVWDIQKNKAYHNNIAGIGRDDMTGLYQKQATSSHKPHLLTLYSKENALYNNQNTINLDNNSFLIWGDNNQDLYFETNEKGDYRPLNRKWLMSSYGPIQHLNTILKFDTRQIRTVVPRGEPYFLMIDRNGKSDFDANNAEIIKADSIDTEGYAYFKNVQWDIDGSGSDVFSIATLNKASNIIIDINKGNLNKATVYPNPVTDGNFTLRIDLFQAGDIDIKIYDISGKLVSNEIMKGSEYYIHQGRLTVKGPYLVSIKAQNDVHTFKIVAQ